MSPALENTSSEKINSEIDELINTFQLKSHPEGGYYARSYASTLSVVSCDSERYGNQSRLAGSAIYYALKGEDFSAWHRIKSDEIWHYYKGSVVRLYVIGKNGELQTHYLGDPTIYADAQFQIAIPADTWFAAENIDTCQSSFVGCTVSPGFEFTDFQLADRDELLTLYPQHRIIICKLTR